MMITYPQWGQGVCPKCGKPYGPVVNDLPVPLCDCAPENGTRPWPAFPFRVTPAPLDPSENRRAPGELGWMCPHCRVVYAPWVRSCECQRNPERS